MPVDELGLLMAGVGGDGQAGDGSADSAEGQAGEAAEDAAAGRAGPGEGRVDGTSEAGPT